jgi:hypothetical protein
VMNAIEKCILLLIGVAILALVKYIDEHED